ncbi:MAG TPA: hypothetical protein VLL05_01230, partial [Terriglobales bacterium]|nr:hypothetical protein [Terriglobales bacterium]
MLKSDRWIRKMAKEHDMINPFSEKQVREGVVSYGLSSYGYDLRVADEFKIFTNVNSTIVDPKHFDEKSFVTIRGGQGASFSRVAQPPQDQVGEGVRLDYRLTELLPYNGGVVEIETALLGLKGADYLGAAIGVLQQFSSLISPPLGPAISLAQTLASGTRDL